MINDLFQANIFIVDDDPSNLNLLHARLKIAGFSRLTLAASGQEALALIEEEIPDLILLDVMMPDMNGFEVTEYIRKHYQNQFIPIVLVSALQTPEQRTRGIDAGANDFISRPFNSDELMARINSLLALKKRRDALNEERQRIELLYLISQLLSSFLDYDSLKHEIASLTTSLTQADQTFLLLTDRDRRGEEQHVISRPGTSPVDAAPADIDALSDRLARHVMEHQKPLLIRDCQSDPFWNEQVEVEQVGSAVAVPLFHIDYLLGALVVLSRRSNVFTEDQLNLLVAISSHASVALDNARLFGEVRRQRSQAEALLYSTGYPVTIVNSDGILTTINSSARQVLGLTEDHIGQALQDVFSLALADLQIRSKERFSAVSGEYTLRGGEDSTANRTFNVSISPVESLGFVMIWQDITAIKEGERIRLESERVERKRVLEAFSRYMSPALVERVLGDSDILSRRERRTALVLFADLRGFTRLTIEHPPDDVIELLNNVFTEMMEITYQHEGVIFDIAGDELLIAFNVPYEQLDASHRALSTAVSMLRRFRQLQKYWAGERGMHVGMGIGINRGPVVLGHVGGRTRMNYAMVGLTVNVAHRLVDLARDGQIAVTPEVIAEGIPGSENLKIQKLEAVQIKGLTAPQSVILLELS
ncbi:MAG: response regulator [Anaerolineae bacterium]|nr:response regulator [Anaerolineae bacterium]